MRRWSVIAPVLLLVLAVGCGPSQSGPGTPEPDRSSTSAVGSATPEASGTPTGTPTRTPTGSTVEVRRDDAQAGAAFAAPSGNITCFIESAKADGADGPAAGCTIGEKSWTAPASDCDLAYGSIVRLQGGDQPVFDCRGDVPSCFSALVAMPDFCGQDADGLWWHEDADGTTQLTGGEVGDGEVDVLPYGTALRIGAFQCTSLQSGVTCQNLDSGQGFTLSRAAYSLTPRA